MPVDQDTQKYLGEVKKGKSRKFAMICKGNKIIGLVVYKRGSTDKHKKKAKEEGMGQFYFGVITGKGANITFNLSSSDGFDKPATKSVVLKNYLKDEAGMTFKPVYEIVQELPDVPDEEETEEEGMETAPETVSEPEGPETTLTEGETIPESSTTPSEVSPEAPTDAAAAKQLTAALSKLAPLITQAVAAQPARKAEVLGQVADIKAAIQAGELDAAKAQLLVTAKLVKELAATAPGKMETPESPGKDRAEIQWRELFAQLEPRYLKALKLQPANASQMRTVMAYATEQAEATQYQKAIKAMKRLVGMIQEAMSGGVGRETDVIAEGIVEQRKFLVTRWQRIPVEIGGELAKLKKAIVAEVPDEDANGLSDAVDENLRQFYGKMQDAIDAAINSGEGFGEAVRLVRSFKDDVRANELIRHLKANPMTSGERFESALLGALDEVEAKLAA